MGELAADNIPVALSLRFLKLSRAPHDRWRNQQVTKTELIETYRANALLDAHRDDPEFGYRFMIDEAAEASEVMSERTAWKICRDNQWWSVFGKKRGKNGKRPDLIWPGFRSYREACPAGAGWPDSWSA